MDQKKRAYGAPSLTSYGSLTKLTQGGGSGGDGGPMFPGIMIIIMIMI